MKDKIKKFVEYHFRFKEGKEKEELVEEVTSNLLDRFETLKEKYANEEKAYRETIARMGDFSDVKADIKPEYTLRPALYDVGLVVALVLSIFGFVAVFLHGSLAFILTVASIVLFVASAYYTYHHAQYEKNVNGDIDCFHLYLDKSFSYLKTTFIFWAITFTVLLGQMIAGAFLFIAGISDPVNAIMYLGELVMLYSVSFMVATAIIVVIFYRIHTRIMDHYRYISGNDHLKGTLGKGLGMLRLDAVSAVSSLKSFVPWFTVLIIIFSLMAPVQVGHSNGYSIGPAYTLIFDLLSPGNYFVGILLLIGYVSVVVAIIRTIRSSTASLKWMTISVSALLVTYLLTMFIINQWGDFTYLSFTTPMNPVAFLLFGLGVIGILALVSYLTRVESQGRD